MRRELTVMSELGFEFHYTDMYTLAVGVAVELEVPMPMPQRGRV
jgi:hypothetical protein